MSAPFFDREFLPSDQRLFDELVVDMLGRVCQAWRQGYRRTGSLHFGKLVPVRVRAPRAVHPDRGEWVVGLWDCDRRLTTSSGATVDSTRDGDEAILARLGELEQTTLLGIGIDPSTLSLSLTLSGGAKLELLADPKSTWESEQWAIELPSATAIVVFGLRRWALQRNSWEGGPT
jgi:hypothetical protein